MKRTCFGFLLAAAFTAAAAGCGLYKAKRVANETSAMAALKATFAGQEMLKSQVAVDENSNGIGEYGFLDELAGTKKCRGEGGKLYDSNSFISRNLGSLTDRGVAKKSGYCFVLYLPTPEGGGASSSAQKVDPAKAEANFVLYAWPERRGSTGLRAFCVDRQGQLREVLDSRWSGEADLPPWDAAFGAGGWEGGLDGARWKPAG